MTLFSTFFAGIAVHPIQLVVIAIGLTLVALVAISVWALFGTIINRYLRDPRAKRVLNTGLALLLIYTALELAQIL